MHAGAGEIHVGQIEDVFSRVDVSDDRHVEALKERLDARDGAIVASSALREEHHFGEKLKGLGGGLMNAGDDDQL